MNNKKIVIALYSNGAQAGKTTVAEYIQRKFPKTCVVESFAAPLKRMVRSLLSDVGLSDDYIETRFQPASKEDPIHVKALGVNGSPRYLMQTLGTEWGRNLINPSMWVDIMEHKVAEWFKRGAQIVVIDDVRFPNEVAMLDKFQSYLICIDGISDRKRHHHASEAHTDTFDPDFIIDNMEDVDLGMLYRQVDDIINEIVSRPI